MLTHIARSWVRRTATAAATASLVVAAAATATAAPSAPQAASNAGAKPTVVLVHGAWADASSFGPVTRRLQHDGYVVLDAPNPLRGLASDAASVAAFVDQATTGPVVLVGHSYGGAVITNTALSSNRVRSLVYVDAYAPDRGETVVQLTGAKPGSVLAADPATVFDAVQDPALPAGDPDLYVKRTIFGSAFAARLPKSTTAALAAEESPVAAGALQEPSAGAAWRTIPSWFVIGNDDRIIPAAEQRVMAKRARGHVTTLQADHLSLLEQPAAITRVIEAAATGR
jgi:pimeloyl-ACP methyl ester carboxylesterase